MSILENTKQLGQEIVRARKSQGLSQEDLCGISGFGPRFVRELEHGKETCQIAKVLHILKLLGIKITLDDQNREGL